MSEYAAYLRFQWSFLRYLGTPKISPDVEQQPKGRCDAKEKHMHIYKLPTFSMVTVTCYRNWIDTYQGCLWREDFHHQFCHCIWSVSRSNAATPFEEGDKDKDIHISNRKTHKWVIRLQQHACVWRVGWKYKNKRACTKNRTTSGTHKQNGRSGRVCADEFYRP